MVGRPASMSSWNILHETAVGSRSRLVLSSSLAETSFALEHGVSNLSVHSAHLSQVKVQVLVVGRSWAGPEILQV